MEEQIIEIGSKMYHDMIMHEQSVDASSIMKGVFGFDRKTLRYFIFIEIEELIYWLWWHLFHNIVNRVSNKSSLVVIRTLVINVLCFDVIFRLVSFSGKDRSRCEKRLVRNWGDALARCSNHCPRKDPQGIKAIDVILSASALA